LARIAPICQHKDNGSVGIKVAQNAMYPPVFAGLNRPDQTEAGPERNETRIEVTRETGRSVTQDLEEMGAWLKKCGIQAQTLRAKQIIHGRVVYEAVFDTPAEADRFIKRFDS
jgi:hypothetical protein